MNSLSPFYPAAYREGYLTFRGRRFAIDRRAYITDHELTYLVEAVRQRIAELTSLLGRPPLVVEFGTGCGSLAVSVALECPEAKVVGLEIDPGAIELARENVTAHGAQVELFLGNGLASLPERLAPDLVFGDPPWGDETTLYADDRPIEHYHAMPPSAVFPVGGPIGCHKTILEEARARRWRCEFLLNAGSLGRNVISPVLSLADEARILEPNPQISIVFARIGPPPALTDPT